MSGALLCLAALLVTDDLPPDARLAQARVCAAALDFECAEAELSAVRAELAKLDASAQREALRLSAEVALSSGRTRDAEAHLGALLERDPEFAPPAGAWPDPWRAALERARAAAPDRTPPRLTVAVPVAAEPGKPVRIEVKTEDPSGVGGVMVVVVGTPDHTQALATTDGRTWTGLVPGELVTGAEVLLWVHAVDLLGNGPARWGSPDTPRRIPVVQPQAVSVWSQWWLWTSIGAAAATATGVALYFLLRPSEDATPGALAPAEVGGVRVKIGFPYPKERP